MKNKKKKRKMRPGGGHAKGSTFERKMAREISKWWYKDEGYLWRRPGPGTRFFKKDKYRHSGDIVPSVDRKLPDEFPFHIELKCWAKKRLKFDMLLWADRNPIKSIWRKALGEKRPNLTLMLILKANNIPPVCVMRRLDLKNMLNHFGSMDGALSSVVPNYIINDDIDDEYAVYIFPWQNVLDMAKWAGKGRIF